MADGTRNDATNEAVSFKVNIGSVFTDFLEKVRHEVSLPESAPKKTVKPTRRLFGENRTASIESAANGIRKSLIVE